MRKYISFLKKSFMTWKPLREIQSHATRFQAFSFKTVRLVRNGMLAAFVGGLLGGAAYGGYQYSKLYDPTIVQASVITRVQAKAKISDFPILTRICVAESGNRQFKQNGDVVRGKVNASDIGACQINEVIWNDQARRLGYDIYTREGNEAMAMWIFKNKGTDPWNSSKTGWSR